MINLSAYAVVMPPKSIPSLQFAHTFGVMSWHNLTDGKRLINCTSLQFNESSIDFLEVHK
jgi:hypothetical protein